MQKALWDIGAFKGVKDRHGREVTLETAIDGIDGSMTQQALTNAKKMGYVQKNNQFIKNNVSQNQSNSNNLGNTIRAARTGGMSSESYIKNFLVSQGISQNQTRNLKLPKNAIDRNGNLTNECAAYINGILKRNGINSWGNSYEINDQFKSFINGYSNVDKPTTLNTSSITNFHRQAADSLANNIDTLQMNPNRLYTANMYYTNNGTPSGHTIDFYNKAVSGNNNQYATHVGLIYHDKDKNQWRVTHNIGGNLHNEPLYEDLGGRARYGYGITAISDAGKVNKHWWEL